LGYDSGTVTGYPVLTRRGRPSGAAMSPARVVRGVESPSGDIRIQTLFSIIDLIGRHTHVGELLPPLAGCLAPVVDFDLLAVVVPHDAWTTAELYSVGAAGTEAGATEPVQITSVAPLDRARLAAAIAAGDQAVVLETLDETGHYPEVVAAFRKLGQRSACLLPLSTALGPVGLIGFGSLREGSYGPEDVGILRHVGALVAVAIDNERHEQQAAAREGRLQAERDHWRTLIEVTNAVVTQRDVAALREALVPNVRRIVPHDHTNLYLIDSDRRLGPFVIDPDALPWPDELAAEIRLGAEPYKSWLVPLDRAVDVDVAHADPKGWEALHAHIVESGVKRICNAPLVAPHRVLGVLSLGRLTATPFTSDELVRVEEVAAQIALALENALAFSEIASLKDRLTNENVYLGEEIRGAQHFGEIVGESRALKRILSQVGTVAATDTTVLLLGETGTGKELIARAIHAAGDRRSRALVTVNCATSPAGLLESEWFGHERGAFTGALAQKIGRFELAHQGTLFLDEIGDVPLELQSKLLRALQEREIERLGSTRTIRVDFRLIAATNRDLEEMVAKREFRSDLYYRLNVFPIRIPPLRERREDIPLLVRYFTQRFAKRLRRPIESVSRESMELLCRWSWPGNVRELQNVIERAVILSQGTVLAIPRSEFESAAPPTSSPVTLEEAERDHILRALEDTGWVIGGAGGAAVRLGLKRTSLVSTMRRLGIVRPKPHAAAARDARPR
jgi:formate hydrogenlyase transcriptional activator